MDAGEMIEVADRELADCAHRLVEWTIPMPDETVEELRARAWMVTPLIFMLHDRRALPDDRADLVEVDYDSVRELRDIWHREDFGEHVETERFHAQAREVAELCNVRLVAVAVEGHLSGFAQIETRDGGSEVAQVFVHPDHRGAGLGRALTVRAIRVGADSADQVWICAERDDRPRRLYARLGFSAVIETGVALLPPEA